MTMETYWKSSFCKSSPMTDEEHEQIEEVLNGVCSHVSSEDDTTGGDLNTESGVRK